MGLTVRGRRKRGKHSFKNERQRLNLPTENRKFRKRLNFRPELDELNRREWGRVGNSRARLIVFWRRFRKASKSLIASGTRFFPCSSSSISSFFCFWMTCGGWWVRFTTRTMRTRRRSSRLTWRRRLRSCRGTGTRLRLGFNPVKSKIRRWRLSLFF